MSDESRPETPQPSEMAMLRAEMREGFQSVDKRLVTMDARVTDEGAATRRYFDVVAEGLRADFTVVIDKTTATGEKVDRLIASNAIEHAAFLDALTDHEVRITQLEGASGTSKPSTS
jgi:hypothetical protein